MTIDPTVRRCYLLVCPENLSPREAARARELAGAGELWIVAPELASLETESPPGARTMSPRALGKLRGGWQPDFVIYASPPSLALHGKIWWWKRRHAPNGLLGGDWRLPVDAANPGRLPRWLASWALESLDFWVVGDERAAEPLARAGVPRGRVLVDGNPGAGMETLPTFLERRRTAEARSVLWVDDDLSLHSPSTKHLVYSIPHLRGEGWEIRGWCVTADAAAKAGVEIREFPPAPRRLRLFTPYWFFAAVNLHGIMQTILKGRPPARIVQTVGSAFLGADMAAIQFVHHVWLRKQLELKPRNRKAVLELLWTIPAMLRDQLQYRNPRCRLLLPASDSIAKAVQSVCRLGMQVEVLPNSYDETRFSPDTRSQWRSPMRRELGFGETDFVFCFASQGHYRRKGFWLAVESLARVRTARQSPSARGVRLLVVGGHEATLAGLREELGQHWPDWKSWITFTGSQPQVERYLSAADAFIFPSYFEAFCLAEIEAGALGLPLLLTAHHGTEMILRDGINGVLLSYDPAEMAAALTTFLEKGLPPFPASPGRALDRTAYARALGGIYDRELNPVATAKLETV